MLSYTAIVVVLIIPTVFAFTVSHLYNQRYDAIITNVSDANTIMRIAKEEISIELWDIVAGTISLENGKYQEMLNEISSGIDRLMLRTATENNRQRLEVAKRTFLSLEKRISALEKQITEGSRVSSNEKVLDEIRDIASLLSEVLQEFIVEEIESASQTNGAIQTLAMWLTVIQVIIFLIVISVSIINIFSIYISIEDPITQMKNLSTQIASGNLSARLSSPSLMEFNTLAENLNTMAVKIDDLIKENIEEQKNLQKAEMKALQAQISPHFLYNTFDTIIWLAEEEKIDEVVKVTRAFSDFLRISLSRGHEWITVQQEVDHVRNYLTVQKIRYAEILNYEIEVDENLNEYMMLKLSLQPLIENAIYHGIKNKRGRGHLKLCAGFSDKNKSRIRFSVSDDGAGFTEERMEQVIAELKKNMRSAETLTSVYGLYNVNNRLILYFNNETDGLHIESEKNKGTEVWFEVPAQLKLEESNV